jgi:hypothetical protein
MGTACEQPSGGGGGGGSVTPQTSTPLVHTLSSGDLVIKITETNPQPAAKAAISPANGNFYWVFLAAVLINNGTITVNGSAIQFSGGFTLTLNGGNYTLSGSIPNSQGSAITGPKTFTGSTSGGSTGTKGKLIGEWQVDGGVMTFTATKFTVDMGQFGKGSGTYKLSGSTLTMTMKSGTGMVGMMASSGSVKTNTLEWIDANTIRTTDNSDGDVETWTRIK